MVWSNAEFERDGYQLVRGILDPARLERCRDICIAFKNERPVVFKDGISIPDLVRQPELAEVSALKDDPAIHTILRDVFAEQPYRFCGHSDAGINRVVSGWHKDVLQGAYARFQRYNPWQPLPSGETYQIVKVAIYLEDHSTDDTALEVVPGSHTQPAIQTAGARRLQPALGDVIIFDQRITHRGMLRQVATPRILLSFGFGAHNAFTDQFEEGTQARQQNDWTQARRVVPPSALP